MPHTFDETDVIISAKSSLCNIKNDAKNFFLSVANTGNFLITEGKYIYYDVDSSIDLKLIRLYLLGSCMAAILQQRGHLVLHGNAISYDGKVCDVYVGQSGAGKSTMAAWHYLQGAYILSDDVCLIHFDEGGKGGRAFVVPSYPQIKLWGESARLLEMNLEHIDFICEAIPKYRIPIKSQFISNALPIRRIIEINPENTKTQILTGMDNVAQT